MNEQTKTIPAPAYQYDPAFDAIQMPPSMGLAFEGVAIAMDENEATITIRYKRRPDAEVKP